MTQGHEQYLTQGHKENFFEKSDTQGFGYHFFVYRQAAPL